MLMAFGEHAVFARCGRELMLNSGDDLDQDCPACGNSHAKTLDGTQSLQVFHYQRYYVT